MARKITPAVTRDILTKAAEGWSAREIAEWLAAKRGVKVTRQAVFQVIKATREERSEVTKAVTREVLSRTVVADLHLVDALTKSLVLLGRKARKRITRTRSRRGFDGAVETWLRIVDRTMKAVDLKLHYAGADEPDNAMDEVAQAAARLESRLARLDAEGTPDESPRGDCSDSAGPGGTQL